MEAALMIIIGLLFFIYLEIRKQTKYLMKQLNWLEFHLLEQSSNTSNLNRLELIEGTLDDISDTLRRSYISTLPDDPNQR